MSGRRQGASSACARKTARRFRALDDGYMRFWHEVGEYAKDPGFFENNTTRTIRPVFQLGVTCGGYFSWFWLILDFVCVAYPISVSLETVTVENFHPESRNLAEALDAFFADEEYTEAELRAVDNALFAVLGVHSFGLRADGRRVPVNGGEEWSKLDEHDRALLAVGSLTSYIAVFVKKEFELGNMHNYDKKSNICVSGPKCTVENVWCWLKKLPAPAGDTDLPLPTKKQGDDTNVPVLGPVIHDELDEAERRIRNTTLPDHILHNPTPGMEKSSYVDRTVVQNPDGSIDIETVGRGTGRFAKGNEWLAPFVFGNTDKHIRGWVRDEPLCRDSPVAPGPGS